MTYIKQIIERPEPLSNITRREVIILWGIIQGMGNVEIGDSLCISPRTVKFYLERIFEKTHTRNRTELTQKIFLMLMNSSLSFESFLKFFEQN